MLGAGGALAVATICWDLAKPQYTHNELERVGSAIVLLLLTIAYGLAHRLRPLHWVAIPLFLISSWVLAERWGFFFGGYLKYYAPSSPAEAAAAFRETLALFCLAAFGAVIAWFIATRASRAPAMRTPRVGAVIGKTDA
jgi:hypothetical protein